jgi:hypothetical protein
MRRMMLKINYLTKTGKSSRSILAKIAIRRDENGISAIYLPFKWDKKPLFLIETGNKIWEK